MEYRSASQVDRDRVLYASAFARLAEVTQVVSADRGYVFHNRLTHSLKVAQLARRMAEKLENEPGTVAVGGVDPDVAEAAALAHDLGHPPFGHIAEEELREMAQAEGLADGFEGNAQSFRIVTKLAVSDADCAETTKNPLRGLNLTRATLNAILKYPWPYGGNAAKPKKWGFYETEREIFDWVRKDNSLGPLTKSPEAELMDWADDITYAVHDLIDFYCAGQIPLDRLADENDVAEREPFFEEVFSRCSDLAPRRADLQSRFQGVLAFFPLDRRYIGTLEQRTLIWQFATVLISRYVEAIRFVLPNGTGCPLVFIKPQAQDEIRMLKELTWHYVILNNELATTQHGLREIVRTVFRVLLKASQEENWKLFPPAYQEDLTAAKKGSLLQKRILVDYIASLTEREIARIYHVLTGRS
jgi:dGTPase